METWFERIRRLRESLELSQADVYRRVRVSNATMSSWESGKHKPKGENLLNLAKVLRTTPAFLMRGTGDPDDAADDELSVEVAESLRATSETVQRFVMRVIEAAASGAIDDQRIAAVQSLLFSDSPTFDPLRSDRSPSSVKGKASNRRRTGHPKGGRRGGS